MTKICPLASCANCAEKGVSGEPEYPRVQKLASRAFDADTLVPGASPHDPRNPDPKHGSDSADDSACGGTTASLEIEVQMRPSDEGMRRHPASENQRHAHRKRTAQPHFRYTCRSHIGAFLVRKRPRRRQSGDQKQATCCEHVSPPRARNHHRRRRQMIRVRDLDSACPKCREGTSCRCPFLCT